MIMVQLAPITFLLRFPQPLSFFSFFVCLFVFLNVLNSFLFFVSNEDCRVGKHRRGRVASVSMVLFLVGFFHLQDKYVYTNPFYLCKHSFGRVSSWMDYLQYGIGEIKLLLDSFLLLLS